MKVVRALLLAALVTPALVVLSATQALACSCIPQRPDPVALKDATAVFSGTVAEVEEGVDVGFDRVTWTFAVEQVFKGDVSELQEVTSHTQSAACGLVFKEEKRYVVFAYDGDDELASDEQLSTNSCMNTRPLGQNEELEMKPVADFVSESPPPAAAPTEDESSGWDPIVVGSLVMVALVGVLTLVVLAGGRRKS